MGRSLTQILFLSLFISFSSCRKEVEILGLEITYPDGADTIYADAGVYYKALIANVKREKDLELVYKFAHGGDYTNDKDTTIEINRHVLVGDRLFMRLPHPGKYTIVIKVPDNKSQDPEDLWHDVEYFPVEVF